MAHKAKMRSQDLKQKAAQLLHRYTELTRSGDSRASVVLSAFVICLSLAGCGRPAFVPQTIGQTPTTSNPAEAERQAQAAAASGQSEAGLSEDEVRALLDDLTEDSQGQHSDEDLTHLGGERAKQQQGDAAQRNNGNGTTSPGAGRGSGGNSQGSSTAANGGQQLRPGAGTLDKGQEIWKSNLCQKINIASAELEFDMSALHKADTPLPQTSPAEYYRNIEAVARKSGAKIDFVELKKNHFVCFMLPIAIRMNARVFHQRLKILRLVAKEKKTKLEPEELTWLADIKTAYELPIMATHTELLKRVDIVPLPLLLAQGAEESGWGTSEIARKWNNFFGLHAVARDPSCRYPFEGAKHCVRSYASPEEGVAGYIRYMNTEKGGQYRYLVKFRELRAQYRAQGQPFDSIKLAETILGYSEKKGLYIKYLKDHMSRWNNLTKYQFHEETERKNAPSSPSPHAHLRQQ